MSLATLSSPGYLYGMLAPGLLLAALLARLLLPALRPRLLRCCRLPACFGSATVQLLWMQWGLLLLLLGLAYTVPLGAYGTLVYCLRALWGDPSLTLLQLALLSLAGHALAAQEKRLLQLLVCGVGLVFYPLALGLSGFDPYALGFQPWGLLWCLAALSIFLYWRGCGILLLMLGLDVMAYALHWLESANLWDYLLDPLLWGLLSWRLLQSPVRAMIQSRRG